MGSHTLIKQKKRNWKVQRKNKGECDKEQCCSFAGIVTIALLLCECLGVISFAGRSDFVK